MPNAIQELPKCRKKTLEQTQEVRFKFPPLCKTDAERWKIGKYEASSGGADGKRLTEKQPGKRETRRDWKHSTNTLRKMKPKVGLKAKSSQFRRCHKNAWVKTRKDTA